eukprot:TRINITY_DN1187_c0_g1_i1.p2 TRINITY_DN1187_c0_g1~~TRINITY_DN1187_c0_g1_i1.p2  ORF type:complete len:149 (-),score=37.89 TRINITY_DN1187_c0_g1_i1:750-1196(-)
MSSLSSPSYQTEVDQSFGPRDQYVLASLSICLCSLSILPWLLPTNCLSGYLGSGGGGDGGDGDDGGDGEEGGNGRDGGDGGNGDGGDGDDGEDDESFLFSTREQHSSPISEQRKTDDQHKNCIKYTFKPFWNAFKTVHNKPQTSRSEN